METRIDAMAKRAMERWEPPEGIFQRDASTICQKVFFEVFALAFQKIFPVADMEKLRDGGLYSVVFKRSGVEKFAVWYANKGKFRCETMSWCNPSEIERAFGPLSRPSEYFKELKEKKG